MRSRTAFSLLALMLLAPGSALAGDELADRHRNRQERLAEGVRDGWLNPFEAHDLEARQRGRSGEGRYLNLEDPGDGDLVSVRNLRDGDAIILQTLRRNRGGWGEWGGRGPRRDLR